MENAYRASPLAPVIEALNPHWGCIAGMRVPLQFSADDSARLRGPLALGDFSHLSRTGLKGAGAADWLRAHGVAPPAAANRWAEIEGRGLITRLGNTEYFIEDGTGTTVPRLVRALGRGAPDVAPVFRQDAAIVVAGPRVNELFVQTCSFNFAELSGDEPIVIMTSMVGVSVLVVRRVWNQMPVFHIWCDGTFGPYLWSTLLEISEELDGAAVGHTAFASVLM